MKKQLISMFFTCVLLNQGAVANPNQDTTAVLPARTIDGATQPDLIPDAVAFRLFFSVLIDSSQLVQNKQLTQNSVGLLTPTAKQNGQLSAIHLTDTEEVILISTASDFASKASKATHGDQATAPVPLDNVAQDSIALLRTKLSSDGFQRLLAHIRSEKQFMKIIPYPPMNTHAH